MPVLVLAMHSADVCCSESHKVLLYLNKPMSHYLIPSAYTPELAPDMKQRLRDYMSTDTDPASQDSHNGPNAK